MPHRTAPVLAKGTPESGISRFRAPSDTHADCQDGISFHKMQPISGMLKIFHMVLNPLASLKQQLLIRLDTSLMNEAECQECGIATRYQV